MKLNDSGLHLTEKEKDFLQCIRSQGSFFEESGGNEEIQKSGSAFFGWEVDEDEMSGARGIASSLSKKGVIDIAEDEINGVPTSTYYLKYELNFTKDGSIDFAGVN